MLPRNNISPPSKTTTRRRSRQDALPAQRRQQRRQRRPHFRVDHAAACRAGCIRVVAAENIPGERGSSGERYAAVYEINLSRCIFCGYCEIACPFDAITMGHDYEMADYDRTNLIFTKEMLLAEPIERTPLKNVGDGLEDA